MYLLSNFRHCTSFRKGDVLDCKSHMTTYLCRHYHLLGIATVEDSSLKDTRLFKFGGFCPWKSKGITKVKHLANNFDNHLNRQLNCAFHLGIHCFKLILDWLVTYLVSCYRSTFRQNPLSKLPECSIKMMNLHSCFLDKIYLKTL